MQSPGAYAIVNAMKNNPESTLIEIELTVRLYNKYEDRLLCDLSETHRCRYSVLGHHCEQ